MATVYLDLNAGVNGSGLLVSPYNSSASAEAGAGAGGTIVYVSSSNQDGIDHSSGYFDFDSNTIISGQDTARSTTLVTTSGVGSYTARFSTPILESWSPVTIKDMTIDGSGKSEALQLGDLGTEESVDFTFQNLLLLSGSTYGFRNESAQNSGTLVFDNVDVTGSPTAGGIVINDAGLDADVDITVSDCDVTITASGANAFFGIKLSVDTGTGTVAGTADATVTGCTTEALGASSAAGAGIDITGLPAPTVSNNVVSIPSTGYTGSMLGIRVRGESVNTPTSGGLIDSNTVDFNCAAGYAITLGQSNAADNNVTGGTISNNTVRGVYRSTDTPHGITLGELSANGVVTGNYVADIFVGSLCSETTSASVSSNTFYNCYGPSLYVKGAYDATLSNNTIVIDRDMTAAASGGISPIAVNAQTRDTDNCTISNNTIILTDVAYVQSLAAVLTNQTATFTNNTYYVPDTFSLATNAFCIGNLTGLATHTLAEWLTFDGEANGTGTVTVSGDTIVQLPVAELQAMADSYRQARTWYVDSTATGSDDGTSASNAWPTFADIDWGSSIGVTAGDLVNFSGTFTETLSPNASGISAARITLDGSYGGELTKINAATLPKGVNVVAEQYITVKGFYAYDADDTITGVNFNVEDCDGVIVEGCHASGSLFDDFKIDISDDCIIRKCLSKKPDRRSFTISAAGSGTKTSVNRCVVEDCYSFEASNTVATFRPFSCSGGSALAPVNNSGFNRCFGYASNAQGLQFNFSSNCHFKNGLIQTTSATDVLVTLNDDQDGTTIENTQLFSGVGGNHIVNITSGKDVTNLTLKDNIISGASASGQYGLWMDTSSDVTGMKIENCLFGHNNIHIRMAGTWGNDDYIKNCYFGPTASTRDAINVRNAIAGTVEISGNVFDRQEALCINENGTYDSQFVLSGNYYSSETGNLVKVNGTTYTEADIATPDTSVVTDRELLAGYNPATGGGTGTSQIISNNIIS